MKLETLTALEISDAVSELTYNAKEGMSDPQHTLVLESIVVAGIKAKIQGKPQYLVITISPDGETNA